MAGLELPTAGRIYYDELGITMVNTLSFLSMVEGHKQLQLSQIKAITTRNLLN